MWWSSRLNKALLEGNATTQPDGFDGLAVVAGTVAIDAAGQPLSYDVLLRAAGVVQGNNGAGDLVAIMHPWVQTALARETDASNNPLTVPPVVPRIMTTSQLSIDTAATPDDSTVLVYPPSQIAVVRRRDVTVEVDRSEEFSEDAVKVRGKLRAGLAIPYPNVVVKITNVATIDPATA